MALAPLDRMFACSKSRMSSLILDPSASRVLDPWKALATTKPC